jgi:Hsp70 protein
VRDCYPSRWPPDSTSPPCPGGYRRDGTLDITLLRGRDTGFDVTAVAGLADFGGLDLDALVVAQIGAAISGSAPDEWRRLTDPQSTGDRRHLRTLWDDARAAKESLSIQASTGIFVPIVDRDFTISRESLDRAAAPPLVRTAELATRTLADAKVRPTDLEAVLLVGGATRMPLVGTVLHRLIGVAPTVSDQPELLVAEGALYAPGAHPEDPPTPVPPPPSAPVAPITTPAPPVPAAVPPVSPATEPFSPTAPQVSPVAPPVSPVAPPVPPAPPAFPAAPLVLPAPVQGSAPVRRAKAPPPPVPNQPGTTYRAARELRSSFHASKTLVRRTMLIMAACTVVLVVLTAASGAPGPPMAMIVMMLVLALIGYVRLRVRALLRLDSWGVHLGRLLLPWEQLVALEIRDDILWAWPVPGAAMMRKKAVRRMWHRKYRALRLIPIGSLGATPDEIDGAIRRYRPDWFAGSSPAYFI